MSLEKLCAAEDSVGGSGIVVTSGNVASGVTNNTGTDSTVPDEPANPSKREWVDARKDMRELKVNMAQLTQQLGRTSVPAETIATSSKGQKSNDSAEHGTKALSEVQQLRAELALKDAVSELGITNPKQRKAIERLWRAEQPPDIGDWLKQTVEMLGTASPQHTKSTEPAQTVAPPPTQQEPPKIPPGTSNTGAPGADARSSIPNDILLIEGDTWRGMTPEARRKHWETFKRERLGNYNPFAARKSVP